MHTAPVEIGLMIIDEMCRDGVTISPSIGNVFDILLALSATSRHLAGMIHDTLKMSTIQSNSYPELANFLRNLRPDLSKVIHRVRVQSLYRPQDANDFLDIYRIHRRIALVEANQSWICAKDLRRYEFSIQVGSTTRGIAIHVRVFPGEYTRQELFMHRRMMVNTVSLEAWRRYLTERMRILMLQTLVRVPLISNTGGGYGEM